MPFVIVLDVSPQDAILEQWLKPRPIIVKRGVN